MPTSIEDKIIVTRDYYLVAAHCLRKISIITSQEIWIDSEYKISTQKAGRILSQLSKAGYLQRKKSGVALVRFVYSVVPEKAVALELVCNKSHFKDRGDKS